MALNFLKIILDGDSSKLTAALQQADSKLKAIGKRTTEVGKSLSMNLTLPLVAAGTAAIKSAANFDKSMTQIKSLVGIAGAEVNKMGEQAKAMALETGVSANDAAEALFFITSAGLRGAEAMEVLEASSKASAVGLGEVKTVADLATSAMNAYGSDTLKATNATDILVAAVREGKLEASELAASMGSVLPVASNMGVQFHEVGAAMAAMSRTGTNAAEAATQLNAIMMGIMKPTKAASDAMDLMGLSSEFLRKTIKEKGLLVVLNMLRQASEKNSEAFETAFGNVRALRGVLDLTGKSADVTNEIFGRMENTLGMTSEAFQTTAESASFKLNKAMNQISMTFTEVGAVLLTSLLPYFIKFGNFIKDLTEKFNQLSPGTKDFIVKALAITAAVGPLLVVVGKLISGLGSIISFAPMAAKGFKLLTAAMTANPYLAVAAAVATLTVSMYELGKSRREAAQAAVEALSEEDLEAKIKEQDEIIKKWSGTYIEKSATQLKKTYEDALAKLKSGDQADITPEVDSEGLMKKIEDMIKTVQETVNTNPTRIKIEPIQGDYAHWLAKKNADALQKTQEEEFKKRQPKVQLFDIKPTADLSGLKGLVKTPEQLQATTDALENLRVKMQQTEAVNEVLSVGIQSGFTAIGNSIVESMGLGEGALGSFVATFIQNAMQYIAASLATSLGLGVNAAAQTALASGPMAAFVLPALIAGATAAVSGAFGGIPAFADGGIVSGPTLGLMGEYAGARSNPEVIAPLDKLSSMVGNKQPQQVNVGGSFQIKGQDLVVALQRADKQRNRIK